MIRRVCSLLPKYSLIFLILSVIWTPTMEPIWNLATVVAASVLQAALERWVDTWSTS